MDKPQAILFDLDGTLLDSAIHFTAILNNLLLDAGKPQVSLDRVRPWVSGGVALMVQNAFGPLTVNKQRTIKEAFLMAYDQLLNHSLPCYFSGLKHVVSCLIEQQVLLGVVTNKHQRFAERILNQTFFKHSLACVVYGDTLSTPKPSPEPLYLACRQLKVLPQHTWFVGDSLVDMQAATAAGCVSILASYGYVSADWPSWTCDRVLNQLTDLLALIK